MGPFAYLAEGGLDAEPCSTHAAPQAPVRARSAHPSVSQVLPAPSWGLLLIWPREGWMQFPNQVCGPGIQSNILDLLYSIPHGSRR